MAYTRLRVPPRRGVTREEAVELFPTLRQSLLSTFDECNLRLLFELQGGGPWSSKPQALGVMFHRVVAEILTTLRDQRVRKMPHQEAIEIMYEVCRQRDVEPEQRMRLPMRERAALRQMVLGFVDKNEFSVDRIVDVERRLDGQVFYDDPMTGLPVRRVITGQVDALLWDPPDFDRNLPPGSIVLDFKTDRALPPEPRKPEANPDPLVRLSFEGYFQQRFYALLIFQNFPAVERVTLREFYVRFNTTRQATIWRAQIEHIEREIATLAEEFDTAVMAGTEHAGTGDEDDWWLASPGRGCRFCPRASACPIEQEARGEGAIDSPETAQRYAAELAVAEKVREHHRDALKVWASAHGDVEVKAAKGRYVLGFRAKKSGNGTEFGVFVPDESDRGPEDPVLSEAFMVAAAEARKLKRERAKR